MTIRTILAAASGGSATAGTIELACRLASSFNAHVEGFHALNDPRDVFLAAGGEVPILAPEMLDQLRQETEAIAARTKATFERITREHKLPLGSGPDNSGGPAPSACWHEESGYAPTLVARRARFFDIVVLGRSERVIAEPHTRTIEETLEDAGRPVLLAPVECPAVLGTAMAVAWNGSREAVRAVAAALPFLSQAQTVTAILVGTTDEASGFLSLIEYLAWHGIRAIKRVLPLPPDGSVGEALLDAAAAANADLLVMGGFGRSPWREALFGGTTRHLLAQKTIPLLFVH
jgi:nucleotide-binding universal stress UspA family protein